MNSSLITSIPPAHQQFGGASLSVLDQFRAVIRAAGLPPPDTIEADTRLHRFSSNDKISDDAGWYVLYPDGLPAGAFGCWRTGVSETWRADLGRPMTAAETNEFQSKIALMRRQREQETARHQAIAKGKAIEIWSMAQPPENAHPYLRHKGIRAHGVRQYGKALVVPLWMDGQVHSLQFIDGRGQKRFLRGGRVKGCRSMIGDVGNAPALCIAEGFATAATIFETTGLPVAVAFNAGNLMQVGRMMRRENPRLPIILCADDDVATAGNPGLSKATEAARAIGGLLAIPDFGPSRPAGVSDFNDLCSLRGSEAVRMIILHQLGSTDPTVPPCAGSAPNACPPAPKARDGTCSESDVTDVTGVHALYDGANGVTGDGEIHVADVAPDEVTWSVPEHERPCFRVIDAPTRLQEADMVLRPGVWFFNVKLGKGGDASFLSQEWICSPLHIEAVTYDGQGNNFGRKLRFINSIGNWREWAMPMELLRGSGEELRGELLAMGLHIEPGEHRRLGQYLQTVTPETNVRCATQVGWCGSAYVLPQQVIGPGAAGIVFQNGERGHEEHTKAGTLEGWKAELSARAIDNPLLTLAISSSFAGPLLAKCHAESGGVHLVGDSSTGKTTLIEAACSTWGGPTFRRSWRATANGIEGAAVLFNDGLLALDEISECDPHEVGAIIYALGNGRGKQRASRTGSARSVTRWRCFVLSSGERTIGTSMAEGGHRTKAGQSVRLLDVPVARRHGAWDELHGMPGGAAFSDAIKRATTTHYGHAGSAFVQKLANDQRDLCTLLDRIKALPLFHTTSGEGQEKRAAGRFALIGMAGELATEYGLTGWREGDAINAAAEAFTQWRGMRGSGNDERRQILDRVRGFIERHGDSRFSDADHPHGADAIRSNRAGWWRDEAAGRVYLFNTDGLREALKGFDFKRALDVLQEAGALSPPNASGERAKPIRIAGQLARLYAIHSSKLGGSDGN